MNICVKCGLEIHDCTENRFFGPCWHAIDEDFEPFEMICVVKDDEKEYLEYWAHRPNETDDPVVISSEVAKDLRLRRESSTEFHSPLESPLEWERLIMKDSKS
jgi:hypothetical protein